MGTPFRVPYGFALGREAHFQFKFGPTESGTAGLVKQCSVTPDVTTGVLFYTNNTGATTIVALTCNTYGANTGAQDGRIVRLVMLDTATQIAQSGNIILAGSGNFGATGLAPIAIDLMQMKGKWYEMSRTPQTSQDYQSKNLGTTTNNYVDANGISVSIVTGTAATATLQAVSGGYIGQVITVVFTNSAGTTYTINTGGNIVFTNATGGTIGINTGGAVQLVKASATTWYLLDSQN